MRQQLKIRLFLGLTSAFLLGGPGAALAEGISSDTVQVVVNNVNVDGHVGSKVIEQFMLTEQQEAHNKNIQQKTKGIVIDLLDPSGVVSDRFTFNPYHVTVRSDKDRPGTDLTEKRVPLAFEIASDDDPTPPGGVSDRVTTFINGTLAFQDSIPELVPNVTETLTRTLPFIASNIPEDGQLSDHVDLSPATFSFTSDTDRGTTHFGPIPKGYVHLTAPEKDNVVTYELIVTSN